MQYSVLALVTLFAAVMASRKSLPLGLVARDTTHRWIYTEGLVINKYGFRVLAAKRQAAAAAGQPTVQDAAMTNQAGQVVPFDSANVYLDSVAKGL